MPRRVLRDRRPAKAACNLTRVSPPRRLRGVPGPRAAARQTRRGHWRRRRAARIFGNYPPSDPHTSSPKTASNGGSAPRVRQLKRPARAQLSSPPFSISRPFCVRRGVISPGRFSRNKFSRKRRGNTSSEINYFLRKDALKTPRRSKQARNPYSPGDCADALG